MENKIRKILDDLYMIDDELKNNEKELEGVVRKILESKPEVEINKEFVDELKIELLEMADDIEKQSTEAKAGFSISLKDFALVMSGAAVCAVLFISTSYVNKNNFISESMDLSRSANKIQKIEDSAFGSFAEPQANNEGAREMLSSKVASDVGVDEAVGVEAGGGAGEAMMMSSPKIMPPQTSFNYVYNGGDIDLPGGKMPVYKREKTGTLSKSVAKTISSFNFPLADVEKLKDTSIPTINIREDREFGYNMYFDLTNSMLSINMNWEKWPNIHDLCEGERDCFEYNKLQMSDIPEDKPILSVADKFLSSYGVSKVDFEEPRVDKKWQKRSAYDEGEKYVPERISIIYPLKIENKNVYSEHGEVEGMILEYDIRFGRISGARNIFEKKYISSDYDVSTDMDKIVEVLNRGGNNMYYGSRESKKIDVEVGEPELALVKMWKHEFREEKQVELYVPCLVFPVIGEVDNRNFSKENVVVPIIEELINDYKNDGGDVEIMPMLRMEEDVDL